MARVLTRDRSYYTSLISLAIPVALQNLITFLVNFADNLMVNTLGDTAVSGVYIGSQMQTFLQMFTSGIANAIVIIAAQYWGKRDMLQIRKFVGIGMKISLCIGLLFTMLCIVFAAPISGFFTKDQAVIAASAEYLRLVAWSYMFFCVTQTLISAMRSVETVRVGTIVSLISLVVNISLNYVLIFGKLGLPAMGIKGAAIATVASRFAEMVTMIVYVAKVDNKLGLKAKDLGAWDKGLVKDFIKYGTPLVLGDLVWSVNMMMNSRIMGGYGAAVITAVSVANTMNSMAYIFMNGMSSAVGVITGKTVGAGKYELMKEYARTTQVIFLGWGLVMGGVITLLNGPFVGLYGGISPEAAAEATRFIRVLSITFIGTSYQAASLFGLVKSGGDISFVFKNDTIFVFGVVLPSALIAAHFNAPAWVVFACLKCDQVLKCIVAFFKIRRYDWMKKLTREAV
ncbi:MAG: MATE family efflux transporter [Eubacteriales bacterium]|nr:MATE family efflux transporter [Eubacteriales bacterium]